MTPSPELPSRPLSYFSEFSGLEHFVNEPKRDTQGAFVLSYLELSRQAEDKILVEFFSKSIEEGDPSFSLKLCHDEESEHQGGTKPC